MLPRIWVCGTLRAGQEFSGCGSPGPRACGSGWPQTRMTSLASTVYVFVRAVKNLLVAVQTESFSVRAVKKFAGVVLRLNRNSFPCARLKILRFCAYVSTFCVPGRTFTRKGLLLFLIILELQQNFMIVNSMFLLSLKHSL